MTKYSKCDKKNTISGKVDKNAEISKMRQKVNKNMVKWSTIFDKHDHKCLLCHLCMFKVQKLWLKSVFEDLQYLNIFKQTL